MDQTDTPLTEFAPAKVNLTLRVLRRRPDGYHELESLVAFADVGDRVTFQGGGPLQLTARGPTAAAAGADSDNLVLKAARLLAERAPGLRLGHFSLAKRLPVAAGLGGGSADAAAALRLLARVNGLALDDPRVIEAARGTGADVPVCLEPRARTMRGIGEILGPALDLRPLNAVLINPGVPVSTRDVFARLRIINEASPTAPELATPDTLASLVAASGNDLEAPAIALQPIIAQVLVQLRVQAGCELARMSGSGATCFGLFRSRQAARAAAAALRSDHPDWWVRACMLR